jgi:CRISPR/Cas system-associated exonuclease Cas4 (RecB family)
MLVGPTIAALSFLAAGGYCSTPRDFASRESVEAVHGALREHQNSATVVHERLFRAIESNQAELGKQREAIDTRLQNIEARTWSIYQEIKRGR